MTDYQINTSRYRSYGKSELLLRHQGEIHKFNAKGGFAFSMIGTIDGDDYQMKLPAPWNGMRYKLEQDKRLLASAKRPKIRTTGVTYELELPGRSLTFANEDRCGLSWVLSENGAQCGSYQRREYDRQEEWSADFEAPPDWPVPLAAFVAWLVTDTPARAFRSPR